MTKSELQETGSQSSTRRAYLALREAIITGQIAPGERLKVDMLKQSLQTGASPVREALSLLTSDHLVERLDQRGFRVAPASRAQFAEILRLRCALEAMALRDSVQQADEKWEEALVISHHRMVRAEAGEGTDFETRHKAFHMALLAACASPILLRFCSQLYDLNVRYRFLAGRSQGYARRDVKAEHQAILDWAIARDAEAASSSLVEHYQKTGAFLADLID